MYSDSQLTSLLDSETLKYLQKKNRGGGANQNGNTYENFFAIHQIALFAPLVIESGEEIYFFSQIIAFVDDLIVDLGKESALQHFQLKNSPTVLWGSDKSTGNIAYDFRKQRHLNTEAKSRDSELFLVVSSEETQTKLQDLIPSDLTDCTCVVFFPFRSTIDEFLQTHADFRQAIIYLTAFENPSRDKIECVAKVLLGAWVASNTKYIAVMDVLTSAQQCQPSFIRSFLPDHEISIDPEVSAILEQIVGFHFSLSRGFLHWEYTDDGWSTDGTFPHSYESDEFQRLQSRIKQVAPSTFEDLEALL